uniref:Cytochrome c oxidase subunit 7A2a n=1 Tax=Denticeps clupeoides TaxID=299321 RepID=A0AAY4CUR5_9TELE
MNQETQIQIPLTTIVSMSVSLTLSVSRGTVPEDNGMPVHLKGGTTDALLYRATMTLTVLGTGYVLYSLFDAAQPKKKA